MIKSLSLQDIRQTAEYARFMMKIGWQIEKIGQTQIFIKKLPLLPFSVIKALRYHPPLDLGNIPQKYHAIYIKLQPFVLGKECNISSPLIPTKTVWIDLDKTEKQLLSAMKQKTRYNLKKSKIKNQKSKIQIIPGNKISREELDNFYQLWKNNKPYDWLFKPPYKELTALVDSFGEKCFFVFVPNLAYCLILTSANMAFYWHNCSNTEGKQVFAPSLCVWKALQESKRRNLKVFDFEGIWDERLPKINKNWKGFTRFKEGFGGEKIELI